LVHVFLARVSPVSNRMIWLRLALSNSVTARAFKTAVVVGPILIAINHGDAIISGTVTAGGWMKMGLTFLVPYMVATVSSVSALIRIGIKNPDELGSQKQ